MAGWRILNGAPTAQPAKGEEAKGEWEEVEWEDVRGDGGAELKVVKGDGAWKVLRRKRGETEGEKDAEAGEKKKKQRIVFDATPDARKRGKKGQRMVRYQSNPTENWGPMRKAKAKAGGAVKKDSE
jgi:hypothetical protein